VTYLKNISFIFLASFLFLSNSVHASDKVYFQELVYISEENQQNSSIFPEKRPELLGIQRQGRSFVNLIRILPVPNAKNNDQETVKLGILSEIPISSAVSTYLFCSRTLYHSLTIREILFPFHHFL